VLRLTDSISRISSGVTPGISEYTEYSAEPGAGTGETGRPQETGAKTNKKKNAVPNIPGGGKKRKNGFI
jgi:hypothetical protein